MLGLPSLTEVNRRIAKEKFYQNLTLTPQLREMFKNQIESVVWRNKLSDSTVSVAVGETVKEIQVFEITLRQRDFDKRILPSIVRAIPYKILFVLTFGEETQVWMEVSGNFYNTDWLPIDGLSMKFEGLNLDVVYENLVRQITNGRLGVDGDISEAVSRDKKRQKLERDISTLEKKVLQEKQFKRQVELNSELMRLRAEIEDLR